MAPEGLRLRPLIRRGSLAVSLFVLGAVCHPAARGEGAPGTLEYLYVESNDGGSSGGHAAIRFGNTCYHFQQGEHGTLRLRREGNEQFELLYRILGNRTIHASRIDASAEVYEELRTAFETQYLAQNRQFDVLDSLREDRELLQHLRSQQDATVRVPGSAYFFADSPEPHGAGAGRAGGSPVIAALAKRVRRRYGADILERRGAALREAIARLEPDTTASRLAAPTAGKLPDAPVPFASRYRELLGGLLAIEVLRTAPALRVEAALDPVEREFDLRPEEIEKLQAYARRSEDRLLRLLDSARPDWGYPMLVGLARLAALDASIRSGHLVLLDTHATDAPAIQARTVTRHAATLGLVLLERVTDFRTARREFFADQAAGEARLSWLEASGNALAEMRHALAQRTALRVHAGNLLPVRSAMRSDWPAPRLDAAVVRTALAAARDREQVYQKDLAALYGYDLVRRNCVTEIFRIIASTPGAVGLGDSVGTEPALNFIPFVSADTINDGYSVSARTDRPSYRRLALSHMREHEGALRVGLRESNVLTSRAYERNEADSVFLFFTEDAAAARPLLGAVNLAVGIGAVLTGAAFLPFDDGATLRGGVEGVLFSLPELAFVNIRKGSLAFAPRSWASPASAR